MTTTTAAQTADEPGRPPRPGVSTATAEAWHGAVGEHLRLAERMARIEAENGALRATVKRLEQRVATIESETRAARGLKDRMLAALGVQP